MALELGIQTIASNLDVSFEYIVFIIFIFGSIIFFAADFKLGIVLLFFISGGLYMMMKALSLNYVPFLVMFFMALILMSFSLYFIAKSQQAGAVI